MMRSSLFDPNGAYTFADYCKLNVDSREIAQAFGYAMQRDELRLTAPLLVHIEALRTLQTDLREIQKKVEIANEQARREFLIAPVLFLLVKQVPALRLSVEKYIFASEQLKGSLDYYLSARHGMVVIEAKNADLVAGMKQLTAQLIALDQLEDVEQTVLHGAVSIGEDWRFARLDRANKAITEDIKLYRVPEELDCLFGILLGLLENP